MLNERLHRMKTRYFDTRPNITAEHLELATEAYQLYAGEAAPIFRAKVMSYIMEHMTVCIFPDELIVGSPTNTYKGANLFMEYTSTGWLRDELGLRTWAIVGNDYVWPLRSSCRGATSRAEH